MSSYICRFTSYGHYQNKLNKGKYTRYRQWNLAVGNEKLKVHEKAHVILNSDNESEMKINIFIYLEKFGASNPPLIFNEIGGRVISV